MEQRRRSWPACVEESKQTDRWTVPATHSRDKRIGPRLLLWLVLLQLLAPSAHSELHWMAWMMGKCGQYVKQNDDKSVLLNTLYWNFWPLFDWRLFWSKPQVSVFVIRLQSAGTSVPPSSAAALLLTLALSPGVKAPCKPCRGWRRGWEQGRRPQSYKRWPRWPTRTGPASFHDPWSTAVTSHFGGTSRIGCHVGRFSSTDSPWKERHHMNIRSTHACPVHTHTCWHTWLQLTCRSRGPPESTGVVSSVKITFSLTSQSLGQGGFIPADAIYGTACVCPVSTWGVFNIYLRRGQSSYSVKYRSVQGLERSYTITAPVLHRKRVGQVRRQIHSGDFVVYNNLWLIGEYCRTRKKVPFWLQFCVKIILFFPSFYSCFLYTGSERDEVIKLIKKVPVSTFSRRIIFEWVSAVICFQEDHVGI